MCTGNSRCCDIQRFSKESFKAEICNWICTRDITKSFAALRFREARKNLNLFLKNVTLMMVLLIWFAKEIRSASD